MHVCLWDTRQRNVSKDFAGGFGIGTFSRGQNIRQRLVRWGYRRDFRPVALNFAYLAAIFRRQGHTVEYCADGPPPDADLYVFNPALQTIDIELAAIRQALRHSPTRVLVVGSVAHALPELFQSDGVTVLRGEPEQLQWKLPEVLEAKEQVINVGTVRALDELPWPDWSLFSHRSFTIRYDFTQFPTALIQQSRGCTFGCNYCPYIMIERKTRFREPEGVVEEMRHGMRQYGFRSFKFRDPLFGLDRQRVLRLAELIGRLPRRIQFSIESRIDLLRPETLEALQDAGLTSITVGIETPHEDTLRNYRRIPIKDDKQREFVEQCRRLGIRTVAGFMIGFPEDTERRIKQVLTYAREVNPTYANFNIVTPYPGTEFFAQTKDQTGDFSKHDVHHAVLSYQHLTPERVMELHAWCFERFYFRMRYLKDNAHLLWPWLRRFGFGGAARDGRSSEIPAAPRAGNRSLRLRPGALPDAAHGHAA
jgi:biotin synthase-like enzyme